MQKLRDRRVGDLTGFRDPLPSESADQYRLAQEMELKRQELERGRGVSGFARDLAAAKRMPA